MTRTAFMPKADTSTTTDHRATPTAGHEEAFVPVEPTPQLTWAEQDRFKEPTMVEQVNARLKDEFGASHLRVRGAAKMAHLFGVLALTVDADANRLKDPNLLI
jgi:hypothetical protein